jgi:hypothetical protein
VVTTLQSQNGEKLSNAHNHMQDQNSCDDNQKDDKKHNVRNVPPVYNLGKMENFGIDAHTGRGIWAYDERSMLAFPNGYHCDVRLIRNTK